MKRIFTWVVTKCLPLFIFMFTQIKAWAADCSAATTPDNAASIFSQPWIWIGCVVVVAVILVGPHNESRKEFAVIRKKPLKKVRA